MQYKSELYHLADSNKYHSPKIATLYCHKKTILVKKYMIKTTQMSQQEYGDKPQSTYTPWKLLKFINGNHINIISGSAINIYTNA